MKQNLLKLAFSLLLVSSTVVVALAQAPVNGTASINSELVIVLDETAPLVADYTFDISGMHFNSKEAAERYFSLCRDNILSYTVNYDAKTANVHLSLQFMEPRGWDVKDYNAYFVKLGDRYRSTMTVVNE